MHYAFNFIIKLIIFIFILLNKALQLISEGYADVTLLDNKNNSLFIIVAINNNTTLMNKLLDTNKMNIYHKNNFDYYGLNIIRMNNNKYLLKRLKLL